MRCCVYSRGTFQALRVVSLLFSDDSTCLARHMTFWPWAALSVLCEASGGPCRTSENAKSTLTEITIRFPHSRPRHLDISQRLSGHCKQVTLDTMTKRTKSTSILSSYLRPICDNQYRRASLQGALCALLTTHANNISQRSELPVNTVPGTQSPSNMLDKSSRRDEYYMDHEQPLTRTSVMAPPSVSR